MDFRCAHCHARFMAEEAPSECPACGVEAGLEVIGEVPPAMRMFGLLLGGVAAIALITDLAIRLM